MSDPEWIEDSDLDELAGRLAVHVRDAILRSVGAATRVAVALGGLDSSGILGVLRRANPDVDLLAISLDFDCRDPDRSYVDELCRELGVPVHHLVAEGKPNDVLEAMVLDHRPCGMFGGANDLPVMRLAQTLGAEVVLTGYPGDDVLGGNLEMLGSARLFRHPIRALRCLVETDFPIAMTTAKRLRRCVAGPLLRRVAPRPLRRARVARQVQDAFPWLSGRGREIVEPSVDPLVDDIYRSLVTPADLYDWRLRGRYALEDADLRCQIEVAGGVRRAEPLLDPTFVAFASRIPPEILSADRRFRGLFRRVLAGMIPERVRLRRGKAEGATALRDLGRAAESVVQPYSRLPRLERLGLVDGGVFGEHLARDGASDLRLWPFIAAEAFLERECE